MSKYMIILFSDVQLFSSLIICFKTGDKHEKIQVLEARVRHSLFMYYIVVNENIFPLGSILCTAVKCVSNLSGKQIMFISVISIIIMF